MLLYGCNCFTYIMDRCLVTWLNNLIWLLRNNVMLDLQKTCRIWRLEVSTASYFFQPPLDTFSKLIFNYSTLNAIYFLKFFWKLASSLKCFFKKTCFDVPGYFPDSALLVSFLFWKIDFVTIRARIKNLIGLTQTLKVLSASFRSLLSTFVLWNENQIQS